MDRLTDDMDILKGAHARTAALREADVVAEYMGLTLVRVLSRDDLRALTPSQGVTDIPASHLRSFRLADLVMEAANQNGETKPCLCRCGNSDNPAFDRPDERDGNRPGKSRDVYLSTTTRKPFPVPEIHRWTGAAPNFSGGQGANRAACATLARPFVPNCQGRHEALDRLD